MTMFGAFGFFWYSGENLTKKEDFTSELLALLNSKNLTTEFDLLVKFSAGLVREQTAIYIQVDIILLFYKKTPKDKTRTDRDRGCRASSFLRYRSRSSFWMFDSVNYCGYYCSCLLFCSMRVQKGTCCFIEMICLY